MKIVAALSWFSEPVHFLDRLVRTLAGADGLVDELIALDGRWFGFPSADDLSSRAEVEILTTAACDVGLPLTIYRPGAVYGSQVSKRGQLFGLAIDGHGADWVLVVDGDEELIHADVEVIRQSLDLTSRDVATALEVPSARAWPYSELGSHAQTIRHLYRGVPGLTVEHSHTGIRTPDGRWLNGHGRDDLEPTLDLSSSLHFMHDFRNRPPEREAAARAYRKHRIETGVEA